MVLSGLDLVWFYNSSCLCSSLCLLWGCFHPPVRDSPLQCHVSQRLPRIKEASSPRDQKLAWKANQHRAESRRSWAAEIDKPIMGLFSVRQMHAIASIHLDRSGRTEEANSILENKNEGWELPKSIRYLCKHEDLCRILKIYIKTSGVVRHA